MNATVTIDNSAAAGRFARTFGWLIRRELWEHRGRFVIAPLVVSAVILVAVVYGLTMASNRGVNLDGTTNSLRFGVPGVSGDVGMFRGAHFVAFLTFLAPFFLVSFFVTLHYALDTLHADRRDRSFLFWKSLPVSDVETVLSKLAIAAVVAPVIGLVVALATQFLVYIAFSVALAANGQSFGVLWSSISVFENLLLLAYALIVVSLWYLPIWSWCMLVSAWAQRAVFLWATIPICALWFFEYQAFGTNHIGEFLRTRFTGMGTLAGSIPQGVAATHRIPDGLHIIDIITPGVYFSSAQLWIGLLMTAGFVAATVWVRRYRDAA